MASETDHGEALAGAHTRSDRTRAPIAMSHARRPCFVPAAFSSAGSEKIPAELAEVLKEVGLTGKCR